jgi:hypothetical protein
MAAVDDSPNGMASNLHRIPLAWVVTLALAASGKPEWPRLPARPEPAPSWPKPMRFFVPILSLRQASASVRKIACAPALDAKVGLG